MKSIIKCVLCNNSSFENYVVKNGCNYSRCKSCSLVQLVPMPIEEYLANYYDAKYYNSHEYININEKKHKVNLKEFQEKIYTISRHIGNISGRNIFDFGTGVGYFLDVAKLNGFKTYGYEFGKYGQEQIIKKGHSLITNFYRHHNYFDIITLWDVAEHLINPLDNFTKLFNLLKPGGRIFIATSCIDDIIDYLSYGYSMWADPPAHTLLYSKKTLKLLLHKCGFTDVKIEWSHKLGNYYWHPYRFIKLVVKKYIPLRRWKNERVSSQATTATYLFVSAIK